MSLALPQARGLELYPAWGLVLLHADGQFCSSKRIVEVWAPPLLGIQEQGFPCFRTNWVGVKPGLIQEPTVSRALVTVHISCGVSKMGRPLCYWARFGCALASTAWRHVRLWELASASRCMWAVRFWCCAGFPHRVDTKLLSPCPATILLLHSCL